MPDRWLRADYFCAHVETSRIPWFGCACCPPNLARMLASIPLYLYARDGSTLRVADGRGYLELTRRWSGSTTITLDLSMPVRFMEAHPAARELAGKVAIMRGPLVYCVESCDNGPGLHFLSVDPDAVTKIELRSDLMEGTCVIHARGHRRAARASSRAEGSLYRERDARTCQH